MTQLSRAAAAMLQRFEALSEQDQLLAYEAIRDYLVAGGKSAPADAELDDRAKALAVMRAVMEHYRLSDPRELQAKQFDAAPDEVREGWTNRRIIGVWARWKFAQEALAGSEPRPTAKQREVRRSYAGRKLLSDDYLAGLRAWLETAPVARTKADYNEWAKERNRNVSERKLRYPLAGTIIGALDLSWLPLLDIASGKLKLADATTKKRQSRLAVVRGEHDFVSTTDIAEMGGKDRATVQYWSLREDFPTPVLIVRAKRIYLREDAEAFLAKKPVPRREPNELAPLYVDRHTASELLDVTPRSMEMGIKDRPERIARVGGVNLWLRKDVEAAARKWKQGRPKGARRKRRP